MIEASFEAVVPKAINAEFEAIIPREKAFDIVNKDIYIDANGRYEVKADAGTAMTQVNVEVDIQPKEFNDVNFYDYEGTILHSYTWDEFVEKNEMPPLPTHHKGLVCQEWNYTLEEVLEQGGRCDVGAIYIPEDGNTLLVLERLDWGQYYISFSGTQSVDNGVVVDWGDNTPQESQQGTKITFEHAYDIKEEDDNIYIKIKVINGTFFNLFINTETNLLSAHLGNNVKIQSQCFQSKTKVKYITYPKGTNHTTFMGSSELRHINIPREFIYANNIHAFQGSKNVRTVSIPNTLTNISGSMFFDIPLERIHIPSNVKIDYVNNTWIGDMTYMKSISVSKANNQYSIINNSLIDKDNLFVMKGFGAKSKIIPKNIIKILSGAFYNNKYIFGEITIPNGVIELGTNAFRNLNKLTKFTMPNTITTLGTSCFYGCSFEEIIMSDNITSIGTECFAGCSKLNNIYIPKGVISILSACFVTCTSMKYYDFRNHEVVPTLVSTNAFTGIPATCKIVVPDALYDQWIVATNWATYKSRIIKASEFVEPTNN